MALIYGAEFMALILRALRHDAGALRVSLTVTL